MKTFLGLRHIYPNLSIKDVTVFKDSDGTVSLTWLTAGYETPDDETWENASEIAEGLDKIYRSRIKNYPSIGDQLDALFHAGVFPPEMAAKIQAVKDQYPKPSTE